MLRTPLIGFVAVLSIASLASVRSRGETADGQKAIQHQNEGNYKEAYEILSRLALDAGNNPKQVGQDLNRAVGCLQNLNRTDEIDDFREKVIETHGDNWRLLLAAANSYMSGQHHGFIIAGEFKRGPHRGGGRAVNSFERDRTRALQLLQAAMPEGAAGHEAAALYRTATGILLGNRGYYGAWRLQYLTDLKTLPDYDEGHYHHGYYGGQPGGAPVNPDGMPVFHQVPESWEKAATDGERWRWALKKIGEHNAREAMWTFADFHFNQLGVQTMQQYGWYFHRPDSDPKDESGTYALHTLDEDETIARLAGGIRRFKLPDEFNFFRIYRNLADDPKGGYAEQALGKLTEIFQNRRQFPKAAKHIRRNIREHGDRSKHKQKQLEQIVGHWGQFEPVMTQPAGEGATVDFRFRNGTKVNFEAHRIRVRKLLDDVKAYLKNNPHQLDHNKLQVARIGFRLVQQNQKQYIGKKVANWALDLEPRSQHFDKRIAVSTPLQKAGAYLLTARMANGNTSRIVLWVADTAIVTKPLNKQRYYFVADAVSGKPIPKANLEFFGFRQERIKVKGDRRRYVVHTRNRTEFTDADGQLLLDGCDEDRRYQWLIIATTGGGRLAYQGFVGAWYSKYYDQTYNATKTFVITDRPVYRPQHTVKFKFWVNQAKYDLEGESPFAGRQFAVRINDPKGEKVFEQTFTADEYGGFHGEHKLPGDAALGVYQVYLPHHPGGGGNFRVEEYKKPEFEVSIESPTKPVELGEKITAMIKAKYLFGAPVTGGKVKYKILRYDHSANWYPYDQWDWCYTPGYWWFGYDYEWYPGWSKWGCVRPVPWWWWRPQPQPEVVAEAEMAIGPDGMLPVEIDTAIAKEIHGDRDHRYEITAEVTDKSRRTIVGRGKVLVARRPFKVYAWVDGGHYRAGDILGAHFNARTLDNKAVAGKGRLTLYRVTYKDARPVEAVVQRWGLNTNDEGRARIQIKAARAGQYRLSYEVTDAANHTIEGGYVFTVRGRGFDGGDFRFNDIELIPDKKNYEPGETVELMINTNRTGGTVVFFIRPVNGVYLPPKVVRLEGKSAVETFKVIKKDMPNFFVEAFTVSGGKVFSETREIVVPPEDRVLDVAVEPSATVYKPGETAKVKVRLIDPTGEPFVGSVVLSIYDKAVEYISGGSNVPAIKEFFWKWRRRHNPSSQTSLNKWGNNLMRSGEIAMGFLGIFGRTVADELEGVSLKGGAGGGGKRFNRSAGVRAPGLRARSAMVASEMREEGDVAAFSEDAVAGPAAQAAAGEAAVDAVQQLVQPTVRQHFADTALWVAALTTNRNGEAEVELTMPENLTTWKAKVWALGAGARVGEGEAEAVTTKDLIIRLQAPRFFVQKDEVVLSANVHNYLDVRKAVRVELDLEGDTLELIAGHPLGEAARTVEVEAEGETRVDWRVRATKPGQAFVRMKALTDIESDAIQMSFPVFIHGMLKTESYSGVIRPEQNEAAIAIRVPAERLPDQSRLEIRYSPSLAGAMVDALPYMVDYPYGCTEQTLNRFLPTVITQKVLLKMGLDLKAIRDKRTNLNAQEIGDDVERAKQWKRFKRNPVFDPKEVESMVKAGLERLTAMQISDGGWGWFSGWGERSYPHTTAVVVHGLQIARENDVAIVPGVIKRGIQWLKRYQDQQIKKLQNAPNRVDPWKDHGDNLDAFIYMVLADEKINDLEMRKFLYRDRKELAVYTKAMFALALHRAGDIEKRDMLIRNVEQFLVQDDENQSAWLNLPGGWWYWYGSEYEAHAYYLKLLAATDPKGPTASRLVKYLINNRKHATYWNSTRDTALIIEAFADYIRASGEDEPDMTVSVKIDGRQAKEVRINKDNLFTFDNKLVLAGDAVTTGEHAVKLTRTGTGPVYFNAYLTNFTLEDPITRAGLEIKVRRKYYQLIPVDKKIKARGSRGQAVDQKVEKYDRKPLANLSTLKSGDLVEIELEIDSKNDYEYILFEDMKAAGFEPVEVRSGYTANALGAYMELRDERVTFFVARLARGRHSIAYRMRAEIPGRFSALPTKANAMYAPELKANSDEIKMVIED